MVAHTFNPGRQRQIDFCEFEASLIDIVSSRTDGATERNPVSKQTNKQTNKQTKPTKTPTLRAEFYAT